MADLDRGHGRSTWRRARAGRPRPRPGRPVPGVVGPGRRGGRPPARGRRPGHRRTPTGRPVGPLRPAARPGRGRAALLHQLQLGQGPRSWTPTPTAALDLAWVEIGRQIRVEGAVRRTVAEDSDAYWATRPRASQLAARASQQSRPVADRATMVEAVVAEVTARLGGPGGPPTRRLGRLRARARPLGVLERPARPPPRPLRLRARRRRRLDDHPPLAVRAAAAPRPSTRA